MSDQAKPRKYSKRPLTRLEREKLRNQALLREDAKRKARAISTLAGLAGRPVAGHPGDKLSKPVRSDNPLTPKAPKGLFQPVVYRPDVRPEPTGVTSKPVFFKIPSHALTPGEGCFGPSGQELRSLIDRYANPPTTGNRSPGRS